MPKQYDKNRNDTKNHTMLLPVVHFWSGIHREILLKRPTLTNIKWGFSTQFWAAVMCKFFHQCLSKSPICGTEKCHFEPHFVAVHLPTPHTFSVGLLLIHIGSKSLILGLVSSSTQSKLWATQVCNLPNHQFFITVLLATNSYIYAKTKGTSLNSRLKFLNLSKAKNIKLRHEFSVIYHPQVWNIGIGNPF